MKAIIISAPGRATVAEMTPSDLRDDDVRIRVLATGVCGTDVELFDGTMPYLTSGMARYPVIPGHEWVGEVCEVGTHVSGFAVGDRVVGECSCGCMRCARCLAGHYHRCTFRTETGILNRAGAFAEYINFPATFLHRVSKDVPIEAACLIEPAAVAFNGVRRARVSPQDDVAIFGDGPIGLLLLMMVKAFGARSVTLVGASAERLAMGARLGAHALINVREESASAALTRVTHGALPSVILEATGNPTSIVEAVNAAAPGGRVVLQGIFAGQKLDGLDLDRVVVGEITLQGALGSPGVWPDVIRLIESGRVDPGILVTDQLELTDYHLAIEQVRRRGGIKTIVRADTMR
jgi:2-desacetyl-2-hydroxyethyl bacteriochlorophyllide A dehydrogenase